MKIHVSQDCIKIGRIRQPTSCPIAVAIKEQIPAASGVYVRSTVAAFNFNNQRHIFQLSRKARQWIQDFDNLKPVEPISIILPYFSKPQTGGPK